MQSITACLANCRRSLFNGQVDRESHNTRFHHRAGSLGRIRVQLAKLTCGCWRKLFQHLFAYLITKMMDDGRRWSGCELAQQPQRVFRFELLDDWSRDGRSQPLSEVCRDSIRQRPKKTKSLISVQ
jgi:hypothetical protein